MANVRKRRAQTNQDEIDPSSDETYIPSEYSSSEYNSSEESEFSSNSESDYESDYEIDSNHSSESDDNANLLAARQWSVIPTQNINAFPPAPPHFPFIDNPGIQFVIQGNLDPLFFFELFFDADLIKMITLETNKNADKKLNGQNLNVSNQSHSKYWKPITENDLRIFICTIILQGIIIKPKVPLYWCKKKLFETPGISKLMSERKYLLIMQYLHFYDDDATEQTPHPQPKLKKIWPLLDYLLKKFSALYSMEKNICIDESLMLYKGRISWIQYLPLKSARFGIKMFVLCESSSGYVWKLIIYTGKGTIISNEYPNCGMATKVVMELVKPLLGMGYCLTMDNYYNSPELGELLLKNKTDFYGTVRLNRKEMPEDKKKKNRIKLKKGETIAHQRGKIMAIRWKDKKDVNLLSTVHNPEMVEIEKRGQVIKKPKVVQEYNNTMGGVDKMDQRLVSYPLSRKRQKKYYKKVFRQLLDMTLLNAHILYTKSGGKKNKFRI